MAIIFALRSVPCPYYIVAQPGYRAGQHHRNTIYQHFSTFLQLLCLRLPLLIIPPLLPAGSRLPLAPHLHTPSSSTASSPPVFTAARLAPRGSPAAQTSSSMTLRPTLQLLASGLASGASRRLRGGRPAVRSWRGRRK